MAELRVGDHVTCPALQGYWRILSIHLHPASHSPIEIRQALIEPLGERWVKTQKVVSLSSLRRVPVDLEDMP